MLVLIILTRLSSWVWISPTPTVRCSVPTIYCDGAIAETSLYRTTKRRTELSLCCVIY